MFEFITDYDINIFILTEICLTYLALASLNNNEYYSFHLPHPNGNQDGGVGILHRT